MKLNMLANALLYTGATVVCFSGLAQAAFFYPSVQASLFEHILVDTHGAHSSGFADAITPCTNYVSGNQLLGRETAAQWLRVAFHDFVTARVSEGTGGIDASIGFETLREEDSGSAFNDSLSFFRPYVSSSVSMADLIALSVTMSVGNCGGPQIPLKAGRIDATEAGPFGVPAPETDLPTTLQFFAFSGFNEVDSIALTACGHTMGSVHHGGFPTVVGPEAVTNSNTAGGIHFDDTVAVFDPLVVTEYLDGTGQQGGPLVTSFNVTSRSDLRLYESDGNATMIRLAEQGEGFLHTCSILFQRMVETVPSNVVLSDVISPIEIKPVNATLDFDSGGNLIFTGYIRILTPSAADGPTSLSLCTSHSSAVTLTAETEAGTSVFGVTTYFPFNLNIADPRSFSIFTVQYHEKSVSFPTQSSAFIVPSLTTGTATAVNFTIAVSSAFDSAPIVNVQAPVGQQGTLGPAISTFKNVAVSNVGAQGGFELWSGSVDIGTIVTGPISVAVLDDDGNELDILFV